MVIKIRFGNEGGSQPLFVYGRTFQFHDEARMVSRLESKTTMRLSKKNYTLCKCKNKCGSRRASVGNDENLQDVILSW